MNTLDACFHSGLRAGIMIFGSLFFFLSSLIGVELYGLVGLAAAQVAQGVILVATGWVAIRRVLPMVPKLPTQWRFRRFKEMLGYGLYFQINSVVALLFEPATKMIIGHYGGLSSAGYFEMAQRMVVSVRGLVVESNRVIVAVYADMSSYEIDAPDLYVRNTQNLLSLVIPVFAALIALIPAICELWVGSFQPQFVIIGVWLSFAWFLNSVSTPAYFAYLGRGKLLWNTIAHIVMGATNILAGFILGKYFGWQGVLVAFIVALILGSFIPVWAFQWEHRNYNIKLLSTIDFRSAGVCFGMALLVLASYWAVIDDFHITKWMRISIAGCFMGIVSGTTIWFHPWRKKLMMTATSRFRDWGSIL
jgi:O-antigen/teichoic acid export membrane protein